MFKDKKKQFQIDTKHIPHGTQVVTLLDRVIDEHKYKSGRTGVVIDSNHETNTYVVRFSNNIEITYARQELAVRKIETENFLQSFAPDPMTLKKDIIYECIVGSRAFGLSGEGSDEDIRGVYLAPVNVLMSLWGAPEQIEEQDRDIVYWELEKYLRLALKANPNVLETLWTPMINIKTELAEELLSIREAFLSRYIFTTYGGYAISQFEKMRKEYEQTASFKVKHALHLIRLLISGTVALKHGHIMVDVSEHRESLLAIKQGRLTFQEIQEWRRQLEEQFNQAYEITSLPELPDVLKVNNFLLKARKYSFNCEFSDF
jgi:uncharacterized protein